MRTIEETRAYIQTLHDQIENGDVRARFNGPHCPGCLYSILEFIDSEPPCRHPRLLYWPSPPVFAPQLPRGWLLVGHASYYTKEKDLIKFCPDCGEELPAEGPA